MDSIVAVEKNIHSKTKENTLSSKMCENIGVYNNDDVETMNDTGG